MNDFSRFIPWAVVGVAVLFLGFLMVPPADGAGQMHLEEFARIPVVDHGRVKPVDTLARVNLMLLSGKQEYTDEKGKSQPAVRWLLDVMTSRSRQESSPALTAKAFRVKNPKLRELLGLSPNDKDLVSLAEIAPKIKNLREEWAKLIVPLGKEAFDEKRKIDVLAELNDDRLSDYEKAVLDLGDQVETASVLIRYMTPHKVFRIESDQVLNLLGLQPRPGLRYSLEEILPRAALVRREAVRAEKIDPKHQTPFDAKVIELMRRLDLYYTLATWNASLDQADYSVGLGVWDGKTLRMVPPMGEGQEWESLADAAGSDVASVAWLDMFRGYAGGNVEQFNKQVAGYTELVKPHLASDASKARFEVFFNHFAPFYYCAVLYVFVFVLVAVSWAAYSEPLNKAAFYLAVVTLVVHTFALIARMYIQGRPPVTNLYSSAVFIGWGCVILGLVLERMYRNSVGNVVAAVSGASTLLIAHHLAASGDTLEMMVAVLDTNFWLATHVTCVTLGYTATFVAGIIGVIYVICGFLPTGMGKESSRTFANMIYGVVCFATLLSFLGTVLGGIWADQSWGRFWGWDPKENGALLIVIWNALILHARWAGMVKDRGIAVLAIAGNIVTAWSWFGTNQLSIGLHNYGFNKALATGCAWFWVSQLALIGVGLLPLKHWRSFQTSEKAPPSPPAQTTPSMPTAIRKGRGKVRLAGS